MIQDIGFSEFHNEYEPVPPSADDRVFFFRNREILFRETDGRAEFPGAAECAGWNAADSGADQFRYLFRIDQTRYYLSLKGEGAEPEGYSYANINAFRSAGSPEQELAAVTAWHLFCWYRDARFCGRCGSGMSPDEKLRAMRCQKCGNLVFPKISPAVIIGVTDGSRLLVTRYEGREYKGYALLAGFCEIGESAEQTVRREVMEETGLRVKNVRYFASQPWGFDSDLLLGYFCDVDGDREIHRDAEELAMAEWVERADMEPVTNLQSLTATMMEYFRAGS